jgi:hypothetical protein
MRLKFIYSNGKTYTANKVKNVSGSFANRYVSYTRTRSSTLELKIEEHVVVNTSDVIAIETTDGLNTSIQRNPAFPKYVLDYTLKTVKQKQREGMEKEDTTPSVTVFFDLESLMKPVPLPKLPSLQEIFRGMRVPQSASGMDDCRGPDRFTKEVGPITAVTNTEDIRTPGIMNLQTSG